VRTGADDSIVGYDMVMSLAVVAIFKNESAVMREWLDHYLREGASHFFLIDNGSTDQYLPLMQPYISRGVLDLVCDDKLHAQEELYNKHFLGRCRRYDWVLVCDLDEFVYARRQFSRISDYLFSLSPGVGQVFVQWKMFGSSGYVEQPASAVQAFTRRSNYDKSSGYQGVETIRGVRRSLTKSIVRTRCLLRLGIHGSHIASVPGVVEITSQSTLTPLLRPDTIFQPIDEDILESSCLHLNHYAIQSEDWFRQVKMTRGSAASSGAARIKSSFAYFLDYDAVSNDQVDDELAKKVYG
jgi:hypothetical protein